MQPARDGKQAQAPSIRPGFVVLSPRSGESFVRVSDLGRKGSGIMTEAEFDATLAEVDRLLNDPEVRLDPDRVWTLLAVVSAAMTEPAPPRSALAAP